MFSKDVSHQVALTGAREELRVALLARGLDQPGVLVAFVEDMLAEEYWARILPLMLRLSLFLSLLLFF